MRLPNVVTNPADPILREAPWPEKAWPAGLQNRPPMGGYRGYRDRHWAQAVAIGKAASGRNAVPEMARLLCLAEAATTGRYAVIHCRRRLWPLVKRVLDAC